MQHSPKAPSGAVAGRAHVGLRHAAARPTPGYQRKHSAHPHGAAGGSTTSPTAPSLHARGGGRWRCASLPPTSASASSTQSDTATLKAQVLQRVSGTQRGKAATPQQRADILRLLTALEALNARLAPVQDPDLSGVWALIYQAPLDEARSRVDPSGTTEGPFLAAFQPLTRGLVRTKANMQLIDVKGSRAENLAEFVVGGRWEGSLNIIGSATPSKEVPLQRLDVVFERFELQLGAARWAVPLTWLRPKGWVQTTYLDGDFRIGRGDKGSIFVAARASSQRWKA